MNKTRIYCLLLCSVLSVATLVAQNKAEYFIDQDPGCGRATVVSITADAAQMNVPTSGLAAGWHILGLRALGSRASQTYTHRFFIPEQTQVTALSDVEYFVDTDPGRDNAIKIPFTPGQIAFSFDLTNTDTLSDGIHLIGVRAKYGSRWSQTYTHLFLVTSASAATELTGVEYWLDTDPGLGAATAYAFTRGQTEFALDAVMPEDLSEGTHLLGVRARYGERWSQTYTHLFLHTVSHDVPIVAEAVEAYWDADMDNPIQVPFEQIGDTAYIQNYNFDTQALSFGVHYLSIRGKINGVWSILSRHAICKNAVPAFEILNESICVGDEVIILDMSEDVQPETTYKWDMDSNGTAEYTDKGDILHTYTQAGKYTITLTVQTAEGCESSYSQEIYVHAMTAPSVSIDRSKSSICAGESVTYTANAANAGEHPVFTWLRNNTVIAGVTGSTLELSDLEDNDQIQVQVTGDNPCADINTASSSVLTQRVYALPEVAITLANVYYTDQNAFSLSSYGTPSGGTFYINGESARLFNPKSNAVGTYNVRYVVTNSNQCTAEAEMTFELKVRQNATITVLSSDETMGSVSGGGSYADGTKVTLTATANDGYHFVEWQDGETAATREITVSGDATYTATFAEDAPATVITTTEILDLSIDGITINDWTINNATINESNTDASKGKYAFDVQANIPGISYVTAKPRFQFEYSNASDKTKAFFIYTNRCYEYGGKNGIVNILNTQKGDTIKIEVAAKGTTAGNFVDSKAVYPIHATALTEDLTLPAKGSAGADDNGYVWRTLEYLSQGGNVALKEFGGGFRLRLIELIHVEPNPTTDIDSVNSSSIQEGDRAMIILHNGQLFILRDDNLYTIQGQKVK